MWTCAGSTQTGRWAARDAWQQAQVILDDLDHPYAAHVRAKLADLEPPTDQAAP